MSRSIWRRLRLRRADGEVYLERWGLASDRFGGVYVHRMTAPDPGVDLHDHPWSFVSIVVAGSYIEERAPARYAFELARLNDLFGASHPGRHPRGYAELRRRWSVRRLRLDECHRIIEVPAGRPVWTVVLRGPERRVWGFYMASAWLDHHTYERTVRAQRRDMHAELGAHT